MNITIDSCALPGSYYLITYEAGQYVGCIFNDAQGKGNDLSDGSDSLDTWAHIIQDIIEFEAHLRAEAAEP